MLTIFMEFSMNKVKAGTSRLKVLSYIKSAVAIVAISFAFTSVSHAAPSPSTVTIGNSSSAALGKLLPGFSIHHTKKDRLVTVVKNDGSAKAFIRVMPAAAHLSTTKSYAQNVMDSYSGWGLTAQISRRGFSFNYVDNAPCAGLVTYFDGASYLMFGACGMISKDELFKAYSVAKKELGLDEALNRSAMPSVYY